MSAPQIATALRLLADAIELERVGPKLLPALDDAGLLTADEAMALLKVSRSTLHKLTNGKSCKRRVGRSVRYERNGLLALARRG